ncbi:N-acetylmuramoyl-L-alanine amidase [Helicobacter sp. 11S03491-1]|uniref:N-acetylmuramoyl-L-alanine amidase family protein n=1 Tax=Helicobacter sp. 11S03491-1 TaxID=1476196 RepID=UPI000BA6DF05|nr:N-acetylmuramoyl-L-alanine amidase [Helicobacter sp. 11S03491-1]PAF41096.1 N-acetylmuramoyl-L-alanine amidase [Helicobacter sp. 11S03491-1]
MWRILIFLLCLSGFCFGVELKITQIVSFGSSSVRITFNQDISKIPIQEHTLKDFRSFLDIKAILVIPKKSYQFSNKTQISIAQNTPEIVRIVIKINKDSTYRTKIMEKHLYISVIDKLPDTDTQKSPPVVSQLSKSKQTPSVSNKIHQNSLPTHKNPSKNNISKTLPKTNPSRSLKPQNSTQSSNPKSSIHSKSKSTALPNPPSKYRIVIDPGHGGKDCGAMGVTKVCEKAIVLSVAKFLEQELKKKGYITYMTRTKDVYINLKERTDFANAKNADLFVSIHANSVPKTSANSAQGIETYFLSTARSERARKVAELENKDDVDVMNYFSKFSFLNSLNSHRLIASNKLAIDIQFGILRELRKNYQGIVDGGVREGPFWVLAGALMPSVLIEIGYNSNPLEARRIDDKRYQRFLAKGIADGIDGYFAKNH